MVFLNLHRKENNMRGKRAKEIREIARKSFTEPTKVYTYSSGRVKNEGYRPNYQRLKAKYMAFQRRLSEQETLIKNGGSRPSNRNVREGTR